VNEPLWTDKTPLTITLTAHRLGLTVASLRLRRRKLEHDLRTSDFVPEPGRLNLVEVKLRDIVEIEEELQAQLEAHLDRVAG
jgi:hypothetical protein